MAVSYSIMAMSIVGYSLLDELIKLVMDAFGLIPLGLLYVLQTGLSSYGVGVLFLRSFVFWILVQLFALGYRYIYPTPNVVAIDPNTFPIAVDQKLFQ